MVPPFAPVTMRLLSSIPIEKISVVCVPNVSSAAPVLTSQRLMTLSAPVPPEYKKPLELIVSAIGVAGWQQNVRTKAPVVGFHIRIDKSVEVEKT